MPAGLALAFFSRVDVVLGNEQLKGEFDNFGLAANGLANRSLRQPRVGGDGF